MDSEILLITMLMPINKIVDFMIEDCEKYKEAKLIGKDTTELEKHIAANAIIYLTKIHSGNTMESMLSFVQEMEKTKKAREFFDIPKS